jgi:hypothetical protein
MTPQSVLEKLRRARGTYFLISLVCTVFSDQDLMAQEAMVDRQTPSGFVEIHTVPWSQGDGMSNSDHSLAQHKNSFEPGAIWNDHNGVVINAHGGGVTIFENRYYWFGEHKIAGSDGNKAMVGVHVYSSNDLYNWQDEGIALAVETNPESLLQKGCIIERPKVIYNKMTGKFVMWFHHELKDKGYQAALTGIAIADKITGPFTYLKSVRINPRVWPKNFTEAQQKKASTLSEDSTLTKLQKVEQGQYLYRDFVEGQMSRDMTLFVDDDGTAYHITASEENQTLLISKLNNDYLSLSDEYVRALPGERNEAPAILKKDGRYFMFSSGLTGWKPNPARLAVASSMMGPWQSLGNPVRGTPKQLQTTFESQSTYIIPVLGKKDAFIFMADRWRPENPIDGRYIWLPVQFEDGLPILKWLQEWTLDFFK